jgi:hypothetical protein
LPEQARVSSSVKKESREKEREKNTHREKKSEGKRKRKREREVEREREGGRERERRDSKPNPDFWHLPGVRALLYATSRLSAAKTVTNLGAMQC